MRVLKKKTSLSLSQLFLFSLSLSLKRKKTAHSPKRHGERGQSAPGAPAAARREDADEGRDGGEEQEAEDDVTWKVFFIF